MHAHMHVLDREQNWYNLNTRVSPRYKYVNDMYTVDVHCILYGDFFTM